MLNRNHQWVGPSDIYKRGRRSMLWMAILMVIFFCAAVYFGFNQEQNFINDCRAEGKSLTECRVAYGIYAGYGSGRF